MNNRKENLHIFADREKLAEALAENISLLLQNAVNTKKNAVLVVSGGSTPKPLFVRLAQKEIPWNFITITLADERWVDPEHPDSNENLVRSYLLQDRAKSANFMALKNDMLTASAGEKKTDRRLAGLPSPFDVVVLGMGKDGHTASLFPDAPQLYQALDPENTAKCLAVDPPNTAHQRITMTLSALLAAERIFLHITGEEKMNVLHKALNGGPVKKMPIRSILLQKRTPVQIFWAP